MGSIGIAFKRFLGNKNTVTIIGVLAAFAVVFFAYNWRVRTALDLIPVPVANQTIERNTQITDAMIGRVQLQRAATTTARDIITNRQSVIGMYVRYDTTIIEGSFIHSSQLISREHLPNSMFRDLREGYTVFSLALNASNNENAHFIGVGNYIDLFFRATDDQRPVLGRFIRNIRVLAMKDRNGRHILPGADDTVPAFLFFAVRDEDFKLLMVTNFVSGITLVPTRTGQNVAAEGAEMEIRSEEIRRRIESYVQFAWPDGGDRRDPPREPDPEPEPEETPEENENE